MSTHKNFDKICCVVLAVILIVTALFANAESLGVEKAASVMGYEQKLFDTSSVHTINIIMDDWDTFTANCQSEEYYSCTVVIDNEAYKNVAIRGKGNTSLTQVQSYGNDRYSFKIEFDHYDSTQSYHGLDKLCLNNIIQDNTYMKDYLVYQMMNDMGVASPLCSFVYITVNGEDWGLYLAVEGVEESFLQRNYGSNYGELYKPDSMSMGGGRGNGMNFDMDEFMGTEETAADETTAETEENTITDPDAMQAPDMQMPDAQAPNMQMPNAQQGTDGNMGMQENNGQTGAADPTSAVNGPMQGMGMMGQTAETPDGAGMGEMQMPSDMPEGMGDMTLPEEGTAPSMPEAADQSEGPENQDGFGMQMPEGGDFAVPDFGGTSGGKGSMSMGSDDVLLIYTDDNYSSYSNIFDSAKTNITDSDKDRLINAIKNLNNGEDLENTVDIDAVIKYFVVHNFVVNFDSYTGSMIHNYYLYEEDGQMQMIPWDYNLAFGGFQSAGSATNLVNYPIDSPVSGGNAEDRPMIAWIFENEEYTELYHQYFEEFISEYFDSGYFETMITSVSEMIAPYVEKDPTKFCTYEEFLTGAETLKEFCLLRAESVSAQLDGTIGSTSSTQNDSDLIDASHITISDMGSMNNSMGGGNGGMGDMPGGNMGEIPDMGEIPGDNTEMPNMGKNFSSTEIPGMGETTDGNTQFPGNIQQPEDSEAEAGTDNAMPQGNMQMPSGGMRMGMGMSMGMEENTDQAEGTAEIPSGEFPDQTAGNAGDTANETEMPQNGTAGDAVMQQGGDRGNMQADTNFDPSAMENGMQRGEADFTAIPSASANSSAEAYIALGASAAVLLAGIIFAFKFRRRK